MRKIFLLLFSLTLLSSCAQSTALLGPAITAGNTGNVMQASFSYGSNIAVKRATGKTPGEHAASFVLERKEKNYQYQQLEQLINIKLILKYLLIN